MKRVILALLVLVSRVGAADIAPRIGILSDPGTRKQADLLLLELQKTQCELLERDQIAKIVSEQTLAAGLDRAASRRLGQLLKADGLLFVRTENNMLELRLVAVDPGVIVWMEQYAAPDPHAKNPDWARQVAATLAPLWPKLTVKSQDALAVSMLRLRPTFGTARAIQLADDASRLLWLGLSREPALFVLDRENLALAAEETRWSGTEPGFWTGSVLIEGRATPDLANTNQVSLTLSLQRPPTASGKPAAVEWTESGEAAALPALVQRVVQRVCREMGTTSRAATWDPKAEAQRLIAITEHLADPRQQKAALGTAMALGQADLRVAMKYREVLRAIAYRDAARFSDRFIKLAPGEALSQQAADFLELVRFHTDYRPPGGFRPDIKVGWQIGEEPGWFLGETPLRDIEKYFELLKRSKRDPELREPIRQIQAECRRTAERMLALDPTYESFPNGQVPLHNARFRCERMQEILDVYRRWLLLPSTHPKFEQISSTGGMWYLERWRAEPFFQGPATEPPTAQTNLWNAYLADLAGSGRPDILLNLALLKYSQAKTAEQRQQTRDELRALIARFRPNFLKGGDRFGYLWSVAFPGYKLQDGRYTLPGSQNDPTTAAQVRADAQLACATFLEVAASGTLRADDTEYLVRPYVDLLTEKEVRAVYQRTSAFQAPWKYNVPYIFPQPVDAFAIQTLLVARFPAVHDAEYLAEARRRQQRLDTPAESVAVTNTVLFPKHPVSRQSYIVWHQWRDNMLWVIWDNALFRLDTTRNSGELIAPPPAELASGPADWNPRALTDDQLLFFTKPYDLDPAAGVKGNILAWRPLAGGQWRTARLSFECGAISRLGHKFYIVTAAPQLVVYQTTGLVEFDSETLQCVTLRAPGTPPVRMSQPGEPVRFEHLSFSGLTRDGLLLGSHGRALYGWDPATGAIKLLEQGKFGRASQRDTHSHEYGFDLYRTALIELTAGPGKCHTLMVVRNDSTKPEPVPLLFSSGIGACDACPIAGPHALYVPVGDGHGFHVVNYAAVQRWLARATASRRHPVAAVTRPAALAGSDNMSGGTEQPKLSRAPVVLLDRGVVPYPYICR